MRALALTASLLGLCATARAQDFNLDVFNTFGSPASTYGAAAAQTGFWQNLDGYYGVGAQALKDVTGAATPATVTFLNGGFNFSSDNLATTGDDQALLDDLQDGAGNPTWQFAGLAAGQYHVVVYAWAPDAPLSYLTNVQVVGGPAGNQVCGGANWSGSHVDGVTYVDDVVTVGAGGTMQINISAAAGAASVNGMQLDKLPGVTVNNCQTAPTVSQTCNSTVSFSGTPSASSASAFTLNFNNLNVNVNGVVFYGITGPNNAVWSPESNLCVKAPTQRLNGVAGASGSTGGTAGSCNGGYSFNMNAVIQGLALPGSLGTPMSAGQAVDVQAWQRDPASTKTTNLSDSVSFVVGP